jgi:hypothetical protein
LRAKFEGIAEVVGGQRRRRRKIWRGVLILRYGASRKAETGWIDFT